MDYFGRIRRRADRAVAFSRTEYAFRIHTHHGPRHRRCLATWLGQAIGWYRADQGAGFIAATVGAVLVLFIWNRLVAARVISDPGAGPRV
jgi:Transglycosylase associated protein